MNAVKTKDEWLLIIQECRSSGLPDKAWCREHDISISSFYYNIRRLRNQAVNVPESQAKKTPTTIIQEVVPLKITDEVPEHCTSSLRMTCKPEGKMPSVCITAGDLTITCMSDVPAALISSIIHTLRARC